MWHLTRSRGEKEFDTINEQDIIEPAVEVAARRVKIVKAISLHCKCIRERKQAQVVSINGQRTGGCEGKAERCRGAEDQSTDKLA